MAYDGAGRMRLNKNVNCKEYGGPRGGCKLKPRKWLGGFERCLLDQWTSRECPDQVKQERPPPPPPRQIKEGSAPPETDLGAALAIFDKTARIPVVEVEEDCPNFGEHGECTTPRALGAKCDHRDRVGRHESCVFNPNSALYTDCRFMEWGECWNPLVSSASCSTPSSPELCKDSRARLAFATTTVGGRKVENNLHFESGVPMPPVKPPKPPRDERKRALVVGWVAENIINHAPSEEANRLMQEFVQLLDEYK